MSFLKNSLNVLFSSAFQIFLFALCTKVDFTNNAVTLSKAPYASLMAAILFYEARQEMCRAIKRLVLETGNWKLEAGKMQNNEFEWKPLFTTSFREGAYL